jgi:hypothetical protein
MVIIVTGMSIIERVCLSIARYCQWGLNLGPCIRDDGPKGRAVARSSGRTKPAHLYAKTKNLAACKELLGHANVSATGVYLGVTGDDARALARQFPI